MQTLHTRDLVTDHIRDIKQEDDGWTHRPAAELDLARAEEACRQYRKEGIEKQRLVQEETDLIRATKKSTRYQQRLREDRDRVERQIAEGGPSTLAADSSLAVTLSVFEAAGHPRRTSPEEILKLVKRLDLEWEKTFEATMPEVQRLLTDRFGKQEWTCEDVSRLLCEQKQEIESGKALGVSREEHGAPPLHDVGLLGQDLTPTDLVVESDKGRQPVLAARYHHLQPDMSPPDISRLTRLLSARRSGYRGWTTSDIQELQWAEQRMLPVLYRIQSIDRGTPYADAVVLMYLYAQTAAVQTKGMALAMSLVMLKALHYRFPLREASKWQDFVATSLGADFDRRSSEAPQICQAAAIGLLLTLPPGADLGLPDSGREGLTRVEWRTRPVTPGMSIAELLPILFRDGRNVAATADSSTILVAVPYSRNTVILSRDPKDEAWSCSIGQPSFEARSSAGYDGTRMKARWLGDLTVEWVYCGQANAISRFMDAAYSEQIDMACAMD